MYKTIFESHLIQQAFQYPSLTPAEEATLLVLWHQQHDTKALAAITQAYDKYVMRLALKYKNYGFALCDLIQEGRLGLLVALMHFEPQKHSIFAAYAKWWIINAIQRYIYQNWSIVHHTTVPQSKMLFFKMLYYKSHFVHDPDSSSEIDSIALAKNFHVSLKSLEEIMEMLNFQTLSLDDADDHGSQTLGNRFICADLNPEEACLDHHNAKNHQQWLLKCLHVLSEREAFIIAEHRLKDPPKTLEEIGACLSITKERTRQLEQSAFKKMLKLFIKEIPEMTHDFF